MLTLAVWWQLSQRDGLPTGARPADGSALVASVVQAPTPGDAGAIYLWAQPPNSETPRSYRLPYTRQLERVVTHAAGAAKHGRPMGVRTAKKGKSSKGRRRDEVTSSMLQFYRLPPHGLEAKDPSE